MKQTSGYTSSARYECLENLQKESVEICLTYCGREDCEPGHRFGPNQRSSYVLHAVRRGKGTLETGGKRYSLGSGDAFMIPPDMDAWYEADREDPWSYIWVGFTGLKADECAASCGFSVKTPVRRLACIDKLKAYVDAILESHQLTYANELRRNGFLMLFFSDLMEDYLRSVSAAGVVHQYPGSVYVQHAVEYIACNFNKKIKINDLADYVGVNRSYLTSSFKKTMGCSPQEYLVSLRMEKARSLLEKTNMQINVIANAVGYPDQLAFSKIFKQNYGVSPKAYREAGRELVIKTKKGDYEDSVL